MDNNKIFLVDDEPAVLRAISRLLRAEGYSVEVFGCGREFIEKYRAGMTGCLVMDLSMPEITGLEVRQWLVNSNISLPIVFMTGQQDMCDNAKTVTRGTVDVLMKPVAASTLVKAIRDAVARNSESRKPERDSHSLPAEVSRE